MAAGDPGIGGIRNDDDNNNNINLPHGEETFVSTLDQMASFESDTQSPLLTMPYPDLTVPSSPEFNKGMYGIHSVIGNQPRVPGSCNYDDELLGFVPDLKPFYRNIWVIICLEIQKLKLISYSMIFEVFCDVGNSK